MAESGGLKKKLSQELAAALKGRESLRLLVLRLLLSQIHNQEIEKRAELSRAEILKVLTSQKRQHQDSIASFEAGGRADLVEKEQAELAVIESYLPQAMSEVQIRNLVKAAIAREGASGAKDFGKVMKAVMAEAAGGAQGAEVSRIVKEELNPVRNPSQESSSG